MSASQRGTTPLRLADYQGQLDRAGRRARCESHEPRRAPKLGGVARPGSGTLGGRASGDGRLNGCASQTSRPSLRPGSWRISSPSGLTWRFGRWNTTGYGGPGDGARSRGVVPRRCLARQPAGAGRTPRRGHRLRHLWCRGPGRVTRRSPGRSCPATAAASSRNGLGSTRRPGRVVAAGDMEGGDRPGRRPARRCRGLPGTRGHGARHRRDPRRPPCGPVMPSSN